MIDFILLTTLTVWAAFRIGPFNHALAWLAGARWGQSVSAYLWALDKGYVGSRWLDWLGAKMRFDRWPPAVSMAVCWCLDVLVRLVRMAVDFVPWALVRQDDHCKVAFEREART